MPVDLMFGDSFNCVIQLIVSRWVDSVDCILLGYFRIILTFHVLEIGGIYSLLCVGEACRVIQYREMGRF